MEWLRFAKYLGAAALIVFVYFYGYGKGEAVAEYRQLAASNKRLAETIDYYQEKQSEQLKAMEALRRSESAARSDSERMRLRVAELEKRASTPETKFAVRCLDTLRRSKEIIDRDTGIIEFCGKILK